MSQSTNSTQAEELVSKITLVEHSENLQRTEEHANSLTSSDQKYKTTCPPTAALRVINKLEQRRATNVIQIVAAKMRELKIDNWTIAGGFATYVLGYTNHFEDIDVFYAAQKRGREVIEFEDCDFNIDLVAFELDPKLNNLQFITAFLLSFDLPICRAALLLDGDKIRVLNLTQYTLMHKTVWRKTPAREAKYKERMRENTIKLSAKEELITEAIVLATLQTGISLDDFLYPTK